MKPVAILGCGPAGLLAAHACNIAGFPFAILSHPIKSRLGGAQFLHRSIPELTDGEPDGLIKYKTVGSSAIYREKVYGAMNVPFVSMDFVPGEQPAWSLRDIYDILWAEYAPIINAGNLTPGWLEENKNDYALIVSSIPKQSICKPWAPHHFTSVRVKILNEALDSSVPENTVVYDGTQDRSWYRMSKIFGVGSTEWGSKVEPPIKNLVAATKPIANNCDCWPEFLKVGRHGRWEKGVLSHDGFESTLQALRAMQ